MSAWVFIHPVDLVKTRMQLLGDEAGDATAFSVGKDLVRFFFCGGGRVYLVCFYIAMRNVCTD